MKKFTRYHFYDSSLKVRGHILSLTMLIEVEIEVVPTESILSIGTEIKQQFIVI